MSRLGALVKRAFRDGVSPPPIPQPCGWEAARFTGTEDAPGPDVGADTPAWLATAPKAEGVTGRFFVDREPVETAPPTPPTSRGVNACGQKARG